MHIHCTVYMYLQYIYIYFFKCIIYCSVCAKSRKMSRKTALFFITFALQIYRIVYFFSIYLFNGLFEVEFNIFFSATLIYCTLFQFCDEKSKKKKRKLGEKLLHVHIHITCDFRYGIIICTYMYLVTHHSTTHYLCTKSNTHKYDTNIQAKYFDVQIMCTMYVSQCPIDSLTNQTCIKSIYFIVYELEILMVLRIIILTLFRCFRKKNVCDECVMFGSNICPTTKFVI